MESREREEVEETRSTMRCDYKIRVPGGRSRGAQNEMFIKDARARSLGGSTSPKAMGSR